jgi:uncharacterized protein YdaU (DUF1376 family)
VRLTGLWWWIDRWRKSSAYTGLTLEEQGAYRNLLDEAALRGGAIPNDEDTLARACGDARKWRRVREVVLRRFTLTDHGWRHHTMDEVLAESQRRADKQRKYRNAHGNDRGNDSGNDSSNDRGNNPRPPDPDPDPVKIPPRKIPGGDLPPARVERQPVQGHGAGSGTFPRDHLRCVQPCGRVCFPDALFAELVRARGGANADAEVRAWHARVNAAWATGGPHWAEPVGDDKFAFWRARWREDYGTTAKITNAVDVLYRDSRSVDEQADAVRAILAAEKGRR